MDGIRLVCLGTHGSPPTAAEGGFGVTFNDITKDDTFQGLVHMVPTFR